MQGFLLQCSLFFKMQPHLFPNDSPKITHNMLLLKGRALQWAQSMRKSNNTIINSLIAFTLHFKEVFSQTANALSILDQLYRLC